MDNSIKLNECVVLAGGQGTRLQSVVHDIPKPMADINGKPFLEYLLHFLHLQKCCHCVLSVGYKHEIIKAYFGNKYRNIDLDYAIENEPLGTGGGIKHSLPFISQNDFFLLNGDSFFDVNLEKLSEFHFQNNAAITLSVKEMSHVDRYGTLNIDNNRIVRFNEKMPVEKGYINAGVYVVAKNVFDEKYVEKERFSFEKDILEAHIHNLPFYAFVSTGYFVDIGIPEDYRKAQSALKEIR
ncbi:MAG: nucleotidyltransferase family protein [Bacteroidales bacterium]|jgi:D-glycero-alpha-D-manno-heptose 1-phosphate guanylyltransferase|nr:nucleotidyltransferase family protein [Bacteroidales bacterium]